VSCDRRKEVVLLICLYDPLIPPCFSQEQLGGQKMKCKKSTYPDEAGDDLGYKLKNTIHIYELIQSVGGLSVCSTSSTSLI